MEEKLGKRAGKREKNEVIVTEDAIIITLTEEQKRKVKQRLRQAGRAKFKIADIQVDAIPSVRVYDKPVHPS